MSREKLNLDFFLFDCGRPDTSIELIEAQYGLTGFAVVVKLLQEIYGGEHGYYLDYTNDFELMFCKKNQIDADNLKSIVASSVERGIFDRNLFEIFNVLTSEKIQKRYFDAVARRKGIFAIKEYLLLQVGEISDNVHIKQLNVDIIHENDNILQQKRKDKIREDNIKENKKENANFEEAEQLFEILCQSYPVKNGKASVSLKQKIRLYKVGKEEMMRCINRYKMDLEANPWKQPKHCSTFFNTGYIDYLDKNYEQSMSVVPTRRTSKKNQFCDFEQRNYNKSEMSEIESLLLKKGG